MGVRNHVVILPLDDLSNAACEKVANNIKGTMAIPHAYGRLQFGEDLELFFRTMIGTGANPNVAAVVVIGIEPDWTRRIVDGIAKTGKPVAGFSIERNGELKTIGDGLLEGQGVSCSGPASCAASRVRPQGDLDHRQVRRVRHDERASPPTRPSATPSTSWWRWAPPQLRRNHRDHRRRDWCARAAGPPQRSARSSWPASTPTRRLIDDNKTDDLSGSQPTKGNIRGGLTTIEEKAFGNLQKIGKKANYVGVLDKAEAPTGPGLWFMDTSSAAAEAVTLWAASGFVAHFFPTGQGNIIGNPIEPVIKLTANPITAKTMSEHIDYDCSAILRGEMTLDQSGDNLLQMLIRTCNGRLTAQEALGHEEFVLTKLYESA